MTVFYVMPSAFVFGKEMLMHKVLKHRDKYVQTGTNRDKYVQLPWKIFQPDS